MVKFTTTNLKWYTQLQVTLFYAVATIHMEWIDQEITLQSDHSSMKTFKYRLEYY